MSSAAISGLLLACLRIMCEVWLWLAVRLGSQIFLALLRNSLFWPNLSALNKERFVNLVYLTGQEG